MDGTITFENLPVPLVVMRNQVREALLATQAAANTDGSPQNLPSRVASPLSGVTTLAHNEENEKSIAPATAPAPGRSAATTTMAAIVKKPRLSLGLCKPSITSEEEEGHWLEKGEGQGAGAIRLCPYFGLHLYDPSYSPSHCSCTCPSHFRQDGCPSATFGSVAITELGAKGNRQGKEEGAGSERICRGAQEHREHDHRWSLDQEEWPSRTIVIESIRTG